MPRPKPGHFFGRLKIMQFEYKQHQRLLLATAVMVMLAATAIAYWPGLHGPFLFDDNPNIVNNIALRLANLSPHELLRAAFSSRSGILYRPLSMLSFALNIYLFGGNSFYFKLTNLVSSHTSGQPVLPASMRSRPTT